MGSEVFGAFERIMELAIRHRSGLEPAVKNFRRPFHCAAAGAGITNSVKIFFVQVVHGVTRALLKFCNRSENLAFFTSGTFPDWDRRRPVTVAGDVPVA